MPCVAVDPSRAERMDYTSGLGWSEPYDLVVPKPEFQSRLFAFVRPVQPLVSFIKDNTSVKLFTSFTSYYLGLAWIALVHRDCHPDDGNVDFDISKISNWKRKQN